jgi:hypothetical protein
MFARLAALVAIPIDDRHCFAQRFSPTGFILNALDSIWCHRIASARIQVKTYPFSFALPVSTNLPAGILPESSAYQQSGSH